MRKSIWAILIILILVAGSAHGQGIRVEDIGQGDPPGFKLTGISLGTMDLAFGTQRMEYFESTESVEPSEKYVLAADLTLEKQGFLARVGSNFETHPTLTAGLGFQKSPEGASWVYGEALYLWEFTKDETSVAFMESRSARLILSLGIIFD